MPFNALGTLSSTRPLEVWTKMPPVSYFLQPSGYASQAYGRRHHTHTYTKHCTKQAVFATVSLVQAHIECVLTWNIVCIQARSLRSNRD